MMKKITTLLLTFLAGTVKPKPMCSPQHRS